MAGARDPVERSLDNFHDSLFYDRGVIKVISLEWLPCVIHKQSIAININNKDEMR